MVITINGIPGSGKNVLATYLAKTHFKKYNSILRKIIRKILHEELILNNVFLMFKFCSNVVVSMVLVCLTSRK